MKGKDERLSKAGYLLIIASLQFTIFWKIAEFLRDEYSVSRDVISALGIGENSLLFNSSVILLGLSGLGAVYILKDYDRIFATLLFISSVGAIGVGIFPMNISLPHTIAALLTFLFTGLATLYSYRIEESTLKYIWLILGVTSLTALILFITGNYMGIGKGGMERLIVYPVLLWLMMYGRGLIK